MSDWTNVEDKLPPEKIPVETLSKNGQYQILVRRGGLWFVPDYSMYVYYTPILWKLSQ